MLNLAVSAIILILTVLSVDPFLNCFKYFDIAVEDRENICVLYGCEKSFVFNLTQLLLLINDFFYANHVENVSLAVLSVDAEERELSWIFKLSSLLPPPVLVPVVVLL